MTTVITANVGGYDTPKTHCRQSVPVEFVTFTDRDDRHPRMTAKEPKLRPWDYSDDGPWIWIDSAFTITSSTFVEEALATVGDQPLGQWDHPHRNCVYLEAAHVEQIKGSIAKYDGYPAWQQAERYADAGHPAAWGLWATGLIVYTRPVEYLAALWWAELNEWGYQDQISQPVALRRAGLRPVSLPGGLHRSPWLKWHPHRHNR